MLNARVIFKKETKDAMNKSLSHTEKRRLRLEKLKELDEGGYLSSATNRSDVGEMIGLPNRKQAYDWATREIDRGCLTETVAGFGTGRKPIYEYHYEPNPVVRKPEKKKSKVSSKEMFEKLKELYRTGELDKAECRSDVVRLLGFKDYNVGYTWVVNWIRSGYIKEKEIERVGIGSSARVIAKYSLTGAEPKYRKEDTKVKVSNKTTETKKPVKIEPVADKVYPMPEEEKSIKIEITKGELTIKLEAPDYESAGELVKEVLKGE